MLAVILLALLAYSEGQGRCKFEYTRQPVTGLTCNPFDSQYQPPRVTLQLECEARKNEAGGGGGFKIKWFRRNLTGVVENLGGVTMVSSMSPLMKRSIFDFSNQSSSSSLAGAYWCQITNTGSNTTLQQSNVLTLLTLESYVCYNICSGAQSVAKKNCANPLMEASSTADDLYTSTVALATCPLTSTTMLPYKLTASLTSSSPAPAPTPSPSLAVAPSDELVLLPAIVLIVCIAATITVVSITTLLIILCVRRRKTIKTTQSTVNILEDRNDSMGMSGMGQSSDPSYSIINYSVESQNQEQFTDNTWTTGTEGVENRSPHEEPEYCNPHYFQVHSSPSPDHNEAQEHSTNPADYQPLNTDTRDCASMYSTTTTAGRMRAPSVEVEGKLYAIVDPTRREEHTYTTPQQ